MEKHSVSRLLGAPPGYIGYDEGGILTEYVRRKPYSVVLFDEVEKAHPDIFNILLQLMDDGRLTDSQGTTINCSNIIVLLTSNLGANAIERFETEEQYEKMKATVMQAVKSHFRPEFLNRLDDIVIFHRLTKEQMKPIVQIQLKRLEKLLQESKIHFQITEDAINLLAQEGFDPVYGARPLKRVIQRKLYDALSEAILQQKIQEGQIARISVENNQLLIQPLSTQ